MRKADLKHNHRSSDSPVARYRGFTERIVGAQRVVRTATEKQDIAEIGLVAPLRPTGRGVSTNIWWTASTATHSQLNEYLGVTIPRNPSRKVCHAVLFGGTYKDFGDLKGFSKKVLPDSSNPFLVVKQSHADKIDEVFKIRNYLAHYSAAARRALDRMYEKSYSMKRFQEPGRFLLANDGRRL
jgi:hypothetical protein